MATVVIPWATGGGNITVTYGGVGNSTSSISSTANEGIDRLQIVTVQTSAGSPQKSVQLTVMQQGPYEVLEASDGALTDTNNDPLWVLKSQSYIPSPPVRPS
jgi:hypothetical protein